MQPTTELIYGIDCTIPPQPNKHYVDGFRKKKDRQKFERVVIPDSFDEIEFDSEGNPLYDEEQIKFIQGELEKIENGYWFYNNGELTYITGDHYYYLNYWTLENGEKPEYRDADRRWFIFFKECKNDPRIKGVIRVKKRREGATSQASCLLTKSASTAENQRCGIISKTGTDAADLFTNMVVYGFRALPVFLQPRTEKDEDPKKKLVFVKPSGKKKKGNIINTKREGLNSFIEWRNTAKNSFDSGRWSLMLVDEAGKYEMSIVEYWKMLKKVLSEGANKVGFAMVISTVNPPNVGGEDYKKLWDESNQFAEGRITTSGLVRYFTPAWDGFKGYIDEYGMSLQEEATEYILKYERNGEQDIRDYPMSEEEAFRFSQDDSPFNLDNIRDQRKYLTENPKFLRKGRFLIGDDDKVEFVDDKSGNWEILELPPNPNNCIVKSGQIIPCNTHNYAIGIDPYRLNNVGLYGSKGVIWVGKKMDISALEETCLPIAKYKGRPRLKDDFFEEARMAAMYYGCTATFELDATDDFIQYFKNKKSTKLIGREPDEVINPTKARARKVGFGVKSADPFALEKQLKVTVSYIEHHCHKIYFPSLLEDLEKYKHDDRTERDESVAFMILLLAMLGDNKAQQQEKRERAVLETYSVNLWSY